SMLVAQAKKAGEIFTGGELDDEEMEPVLKSIAGQTLNLVLIGMPGCGKSTIGRLLAKRTWRTFTDLDEEIEKKAGAPIPVIFATKGEACFRQLETAVLAEVSKESGRVIATGGGIVTRPENRDLLRQNSRVIFLERELDRLPVDGRPVSQSRRLEDLLAQRLPAYEGWCDTVIGNNGDPEETIRQILSAIE
ncbi:MAG: shikimate kinase, partial [Firmicutes bacterium]|nr:shikimate kinase [Bacillota bacterium]